MAVTPAAKGGILGLTSRIVLNGNACPVVHGIGEAIMAGLPSDNDAALARPLGDGCDSSQTAQSGVIAPQQGIPSLCEQRGEDDPSDSRQGCEDFHVMLLRLPRSGILFWDEPGSQGIERLVSYGLET